LEIVAIYGVLGGKRRDPLAALFVIFTKSLEKVGYMPRYILKVLTLLLFVLLVQSGQALVPPHPLYKAIPAAFNATMVESSVFTGQTRTRLPNSILVLRVQFSDVSFRPQAVYPDNLAHDEAFFNRWMIHLQDFFREASHDFYKLDYHLYPQVLTMPNPMAYYGGDTDEKIDANLAQMLPHIMSLIDAEVDFSAYGGVIIFHAGAGQESDVDTLRRNEIWSTFLTRKNLQAFFDPENDNYPGFTTNDGAILTNIVVIPEDEYQDYFPAEGEENASAYLFSIYGVLAHQFGHVLGLPTLFDNDSSNGISQGIGNWGLMGTGVWNGNGYVPAQPDAWCRYLLGWETPVVITQDSPVNPVDYFLDHSASAIRVYKIPLSATEYFLIENRHQNPDGSLDPYSNQYSYSFKLLPEGEQDYYENYPLLPYFNFMENSYLGSEWDFFLPGLGGPIPNNSTLPQDGSGLLIWHIDEQIIDENFTANFDNNRVNSNAAHKGVDLEEADGTQNLDVGVYDTYKWGSPFDSFRADNNDYFGNQNHNGMLSLPVANSYYGGVPLEITNISASGLQMTFSVNFGWRRTTNYTGANPINAAAIDFDGDGDTELFYPMPNGQLYMWDNEELMADYPLFRMPVVAPYTWDGQSLYIPMQQENLCRLYHLSSTLRNYVFTKLQSNWASHPVDLGDTIALPFNNSDSGSSVVLYDKTNGTSEEIASFEGRIVGNMIHFSPDELSLVIKEPDGVYKLKDIRLSDYDVLSATLPIPADSAIVAVYKVRLPIKSELVVQCPNSVYLLDFGMQISNGFPFVHNMVSVSDSSFVAPLSFADVDGNGSIDILISGDNGLAVIDYSGELMSPENLISNVDADTLSATISAGVCASDLDGDGKAELLGNFNNNRLSVWEHDYRSKAGYPVAFAERSRTLPFIAKGNDGGWYIYSATDNGSIFRNELDAIPQTNPALGWTTEFGDLKRSAAYNPGNLPNRFVTDDIFVPGQVYIYPNPLKSIYNQKIVINLMTSKDTEVTLNIYDISGSLIYHQKATSRAYLQNLEIFNIPAQKLSSGVYIAVLSTPQASKRLKFAVEK